MHGLEGHVAPPPTLHFRSHGIHTVISLHVLRDASLENTSGPSFKIHITLICVHTGPNTIIGMIIQIAHISLSLEKSIILTPDITKQPRTSLESLYMGNWGLHVHSCESNVFPYILYI